MKSSLLATTCLLVVWIRFTSSELVICPPCSLYGTVPGTMCDNQGQCQCRQGPQIKYAELLANKTCDPYIYGRFPTFSPVGGDLMILFGGFLTYENSTLTASLVHQDIDGDIALTVLHNNDTHVYLLVPPLNTTIHDVVGVPLEIQVVITSRVAGTVLANRPKYLNFTYKPNPIITSIEPRDTFLRGGLKQTVIGNHFDSVVLVKMSIEMVSLGRKTRFPKDHEVEDLCVITNSTMMVCETPEMSITDLPHNYQHVAANKRKRAVRTQCLNKPSDGFNYHLVFEFGQYDYYNETSDGWGKDQTSYICVTYDPEIYNFSSYPHILRQYEGEITLRIQGRGLFHGCEPEHYSISLGNDTCEIINTHSNSIECKPPEKQPTSGVLVNGLPPLVVSVGNIKFTVGYVKYYVTLWDEPAIFYGIAIGIPAFIILVVLFCLTVWAIKRAQVKRAKKHLDLIIQIHSMQDQLNRSRYQRAPQQDLLQLVREEIREKVQTCLVDIRLIKLGRELDKGNFGTVYLGKLLDSPNATAGGLDVAIKTLKDGDANLRAVEEFLEEGMMMKDFRHPHVLALIGVAIQGNNPRIILPYMMYGSLKGFLKDPNRMLTVRDLVGFGYQIADGMSYLAAIPLVHRDLAARNCMINDQFIVKIADFGLSRDLQDEDDYYPVKNINRALPLKWMAYEAIAHSKWSVMSDVWSFGVVLWELMTRGGRPYHRLDAEALKLFLFRGDRLEQPPYCPDEIYEVMLTTWEYIPNDRPTFVKLRDTLSGILERLGVDVREGVPTPVYSGTDNSGSSYPDYQRKVPANTDVSIKSKYPAPMRVENARKASAKDNNDDRGTYLNPNNDAMLNRKGNMVDSYANPSYLPVEASYLHPKDHSYLPMDGHDQSNVPPPKSVDGGSRLQQPSYTPMENDDIDQIQMEIMHQNSTGKHPQYPDYEKPRGKPGTHPHYPDYNIPRAQAMPAAEKDNGYINANRHYGNGHANHGFNAPYEKLY